MSLKISIIMPCYNVERFIEKALKSIFKQSNISFEILAVDDGSTDKTNEILESYSDHYSNIKIIHQKNQGAGEARNKGLKASTGEYVFFMDPDDWINDNMFSELSVYLNGKFDIVQFETSNINMKTGKASIPTLIGEVKVFKRKKHFPELEEIFTLSHSHVVWNKLFRRDFLIENHLIFPKMKTAEDGFFMLEVLDKFDTMVYIPKVYYNYVFNRSGSSQTKKNPHKILDNLIVYEKKVTLIEKYQPENRLVIYDEQIFIAISEYRNLNVISSYKGFKKEYQAMKTLKFVKNLKLKQVKGWYNKGMLFVLKSPFCSYLLWFMKYRSIA